MKLIYITGIDGCGKTTQSKMLTNSLIKDNINAQYQWLRWSPSIGKLISLLKKNNNKIKKKKHVNDSDIQLNENVSFNKWSGFKNQLFSSAIFRLIWQKYSTWDYYFSYKKAASKWNADVLVLDRYYFDFVVDQSLNYNESSVAFERRINSGILKKIKQPDIFILIDITPETGWERKRDGTSLEHLNKLYKVYHEVKTNNNVYTVDGSLPPEQVQDEIKSIVSKFNLISSGESHVI